MTDLEFLWLDREAIRCNNKTKIIKYQIHKASIVLSILIKNKNHYQYLNVYKIFQF